MATVTSFWEDCPLFTSVSWAGKPPSYCGYLLVVLLWSSKKPISLPLTALQASKDSNQLPLNVMLWLKIFLAKPTHFPRWNR